MDWSKRLVYRGTSCSEATEGSTGMHEVSRSAAAFESWATLYRRHLPVPSAASDGLLRHLPSRMPSSMAGLGHDSCHGPGVDGVHALLRPAVVSSMPPPPPGRPLQAGRHGVPSRPPSSPLVPPRPPSSPLVPPHAVMASHTTSPARAAAGARRRLGPGPGRARHAAAVGRDQPRRGRGGTEGRKEGPEEEGTEGRQEGPDGATSPGT
jgi:hypothetical protein